MDTWYRIDAVQKMQEYILQHYPDDTFSFEDFYENIAFSKRHADRLFKEMLGKTPKEYYKLLKLSHSVKELNNSSVLTTAINSDYDSNEGYSKAFFKSFGKSPSEYKKGSNFIPLFMYYPIKPYYEHISGSNKGMKNLNYCMITPIVKEKRKLIFLRSKNADEYFSFCEEHGCNWEGLLNSNSSKLDTAAILTLPDFLFKDGFGKTACGIEVPFDYTGEIPNGYEISELPPCEMLYFQSQKYHNENDYGQMIHIVLNTAKNFDYEAYGYEADNNLAPIFNFGAQTDKGARYAVPIRKIR